MARLSNDRNELYARHRAKGMIPSKAAMAAGYAPGSSTTHLEQDAEVVTRISELMDEQKAQREAQRAAAIEAAKVVGQLTGVTRSWVIQKLAENAQMAAQDGQWKESNAALELIGKDFGMFAGGSSDDDPGAVPDTFDMDKLGAMLDSAHGALPKPVETDASKIFEPDMALSLIEGQVARPRLAADRELTTGSETDVALTVYGMPDEEDDEEAETD
jgi:hypothetical protein